MCDTVHLEELSWARRCRRSINSAHAPPFTSTVIRMMKKVHVSITSPLPSVKGAHGLWAAVLALLVLRTCSRSTAGHTSGTTAFYLAGPAPPAATMQRRWRHEGRSTTSLPARSAVSADIGAATACTVSATAQRRLHQAQWTAHRAPDESQALSFLVASAG